LHWELVWPLEVHWGCYLLPTKAEEELEGII